MRQRLHDGEYVIPTIVTDNVLKVLSCLPVHGSDGIKAGNIMDLSLQEASYLLLHYSKSLPSSHCIATAQTGQLRNQIYFRKTSNKCMPMPMPATISTPMNR